MAGNGAFGGGYPGIAPDRAREMDAFDRLPRRVRDAVNGAANQFQVVALAGMIATYGWSEADAVAEIGHSDRVASQRFRKKHRLPL